MSAYNYYYYYYYFILYRDLIDVIAVRKYYGTVLKTDAAFDTGISPVTKMAEKRLKS